MTVQQPGYVYAIQAVDGGLVKVGWSENPKTRLSQLQGGHRSELRIIAKSPGTKVDETRIHGMLSDLRVRGEWFTADERIVAAIKSLGRRGKVTSPRVASLVVLSPALDRVATCADEDSAAAMFADVGRELFRIQLEWQQQSESAA